MTLNLIVPEQTHSDFTPKIVVIGVGGGGTNAVDNMIALNLAGVEFIVANTDAQQLLRSRADRRIQLGPTITQGNGAGGKPEVGRLSAEEAEAELERHLEGVHMVFITAGMGGGTGTGAAPVIARLARKHDILTVGVVTKPFSFEGIKRARSADAGIAELQQYVDTLIVIPNQNLFRIANEHTSWKEAFQMADNVLYMGVRGVTDLMVVPGLVNLDFADIRTVMSEMGKAMMGTGEAEGEGRSVRAAEAAISNPLLEDTNMAGARGLLINITGGEDMTLFEVDQAANRIREEVDEEANIIFGSAIDSSLNGRVRVSVVATGIDSAAMEYKPKLELATDNGRPAPQLVPQAAVGMQMQPVMAAEPVMQLATGTHGMAPMSSEPSAPQAHSPWPGLQQAAPAPAVTPGLQQRASALPQRQAVSQPAPAPARGLFAERGLQAAEPQAPAPTGGNGGGETMFSRVTRSLRQVAQAPAPQARRVEPATPEMRVEAARPSDARPAPEPARENQRDEMNISIPTFLIRQNNH